MTEKIAQLTELKTLLDSLVGIEIPYGLHKHVWNLVQSLEAHGY